MRILKGLASRWGTGETARRIALLTVCQTRKSGIAWRSHLGKAFFKRGRAKSPLITGRGDCYRWAVSHWQIACPRWKGSICNGENKQAPNILNQSIAP